MNTVKYIVSCLKQSGDYEDYKEFIFDNADAADKIGIKMHNAGYQVKVIVQK